MSGDVPSPSARVSAQRSHSSNTHLLYYCTINSSCRKLHTPRTRENHIKQNAWHCRRLALLLLRVGTITLHDAW